MRTHSGILHLPLIIVLGVLSAVLLIADSPGIFMVAGVGKSILGPYTCQELKIRGRHCATAKCNYKL